MAVDIFSIKEIDTDNVQLVPFIDTIDLIYIKDNYEIASEEDKKRAEKDPEAVFPNVYYIKDGDGYKAINSLSNYSKKSLYCYNNLENNLEHGEYLSLMNYYLLSIEKQKEKISGTVDEQWEKYSAILVMQNSIKLALDIAQNMEKELFIPIQHLDRIIKEEEPCNIELIKSLFQLVQKMPGDNSKVYSLNDLILLLNKISTGTKYKNQEKNHFSQ